MTSSAKKKPRYVCSEVRYLRNAAIRKLPETPSARALLDKLKLGLCTESSFVPGLVFAGVGTLTDALQPWWTADDVRQALNELTAAGLIMFDKDIPVIYIPLIFSEECTTCQNFGAATEWGRTMENFRQYDSAIFEIAELELIRRLAETPSFLASYLLRRAVRSNDEAKLELARLERERPILPGDKPTEMQRIADRYRRALLQQQLPFDYQPSAPAPAPAQSGAQPALRPSSEERLGTAEVGGDEGTTPARVQRGPADTGQQLSLVQPGPGPTDAELQRWTDGRGALPAGVVAVVAPLGGPAAEPIGSPIEGRDADRRADDVLKLCWPVFIARCRERLGFELRDTCKTVSGLPPKYDAALTKGWRDAARAGLTGQHWELLAQYVERGKYDHYTTVPRWIMLVNNLFGDMLNAQAEVQGARQLHQRAVHVRQREASRELDEIEDEDFEEAVATVRQMRREKGDWEPQPPAFVCEMARKKGVSERDLLRLWHAVEAEAE